ncbi:MAG: hypothetical protein HYY22_05600 [Thaumarchaeota archaeon]|nr:hypothetical protein [Nitrososphaerota archaeon]
MNPHIKLDDPETTAALPKSMVKKIKSRVKYVKEGVSRVEEASGLTYPPYYVEPTLLVATSGVEVEQVGALYARVIPVVEPAAGVQIVVQLSAPLVAFGLKGTIEAVLAHEFMHYVELVRKFTSFDLLSDEAAGTLHESLYADYERLYNPKWLYSDKGLVKLIEKKFGDGLVDDKLNQSTVKKWIEKGYPVFKIPPDANVVRIPVASILRTNFDPLLKGRLKELEKISSASANVK